MALVEVLRLECQREELIKCVDLTAKNGVLIEARCERKVGILNATLDQLLNTPGVKEAVIEHFKDSGSIDEHQHGHADKHRGCSGERGIFVAVCSTRDPRDVQHNQEEHDQEPAAGSTVVETSPAIEALGTSTVTSSTESL